MFRHKKFVDLLLRSFWSKVYLYPFIIHELLFMYIISIDSSNNFVRYATLKYFYVFEQVLEKKRCLHFCIHHV